MERPLFVVMRVCAPVVLSYLDVGFETRCLRKNFRIACCYLLAAADAAKICCSSLNSKKMCKTSTR